MKPSTLLSNAIRNLLSQRYKTYSPAKLHTCSHSSVAKKYQPRYIPPKPFISTIPPFIMKEAIVSKGPKVEIHDVDIPKPPPGQILIKVIVSGTNPKDWKVPFVAGPHNSGDDIAGIVEEVGGNVTEFKRGDRVAAFHEMVKPHGSFAEYAIAWDYTTFHLPEKTSFEEGATIPLAAMTAAVGLYLRLGLPEPWKPADQKIPLLVYGASTAVGAYTIKLARLSNIHPIIAVAGRGQKFASSLIDTSRGDAVVDYRDGNEALISAIRSALEKAGVSEVKYAFDAVSEKGSYQNISEVLAKEGSKITLVLPGREYKEIPAYIQQSITQVGSVHAPVGKKEAAVGVKTGGKEFGHVFFRLFGRGLQEGWFTPHPYELIPGGLNGLELGLTNLMNGVNSGSKYVYRIEETKSRL